MVNNKNLYYIIAVVVVVILIAVFMMRKPAEAPAAPVTTPEPVVTEPTTPVPTQEVEVTEEGIVEYASRGILSDVKCEGKTISAIMTNLQDEAMTALPNSYKSDLHIQVKGINMQEFVCDKTEIEAGAYVYCSDLIGNQKRKDLMIKSGEETEVEVAVWFQNDKANRGIATVMCSGVESSAEATE